MYVCNMPDLLCITPGKVDSLVHITAHITLQATTSTVLMAFGAVKHPFLIDFWSIPHVVHTHNRNQPTLCMGNNEYNDHPPSCKFREWLMRNKESTLPGLMYR